MTTTALYIQTWMEARTRFANLLTSITEEDLRKKLIKTRNSAGFLIRHIGDVELLFAKNVFGDRDIIVHAKTVIAQHDTGEWTNLPGLMDHQHQAFQQLKTALEKQADERWTETVSTKEFGTKTRAQALGRIISHTAYHAGQLALTIKYGQKGGARL